VWERFGKLDDAAVLCRKAIELSPQATVGYTSLGWVLERQGKREEAISWYRKALDYHPEDASLRVALAGALLRQGKPEEVTAMYKKLLHTRFEYRPPALAPSELQSEMEGLGMWEEAAALHREALDANPKSVWDLCQLAALLERHGKVEEAAALYRKALDANLQVAFTLQALTGLLEGQGKVEEAAALYRKALDANPEDRSVRNGLAGLLERHGKLDEAAALYRNANLLSDLAKLLERQGRLEEAADCYREVAELSRDSSLLSNDLTRVLLALGQYQQAGDAAQYQRDRQARNAAQGVYSGPAGTELLFRVECERFQRQALLGGRLPELLGGKYRPANATEGLDFAELCWLQGHYSDAVRLTADAFTTDPKLANDLTASYRYKAACHAASAGCQMGHGTAKLSEDERARLRAQALNWLRADLNECRDLARTHAHWAEVTNHLAEVTNHLPGWKSNGDLSGVCDVKRLAQLPESERREWEAFWADVKSVLAKPPDK
jgi:tetratricopeptide (TPR) repeat protein